jgi:hypothetical protein
MFALQVVFAISYARWRRQPEDEYARNMSWAAAAIFFGRLIMLLAGLYLRPNPTSAAVILPPLEQAINTASILLLIWALVPPLDKYPRALDILLLGGLVISGVLYFFFASAWRSQLASGEIAFQGTTHATIWTIIQIAVLAVGWAYLLFNGRSLGALPFIILGVLLTTQVIQLWNYPEFIPTNTNVAYWARLGNLIAYSLWAVYAYLYSLTPLLESESKRQALVDNFGNSLEMAAQVIATRQPQHRLTYSLVLLNQIFEPAFSAVGLFDEDNPDFVSFYSLRTSQGPGEVRNWILNISEQTMLNTYFKQEGTVYLQRDGLGSRQLYSFFEAAGFEPTNSLLIYPLTTNGKRIGMLVLSSPEQNDYQTEEIEALLPGFSNFITQALVNSQTAHLADEYPEAPPENIVIPTAVPAAIIMDKARLKDLEYQLKKLGDQLEETEKKRRQAEINAVAAQKQARYLAAALRAAQPPVEQVDPVPVEGQVSPKNSQENTGK